MSQETFDPVASIESLSRDTIRMLANSLGPIQSMILKLSEADLEAGAGIINFKSKCIWAKQGHRITFVAECGGFIGSISRTPDPDKGTAKAAREAEGVATS